MPAPYYYMPPPGQGRCRQVKTEAEANMRELTHAEYAELDGDFKRALEAGNVEPTVRCWQSEDGRKQLVIDRPTVKTDWPDDGET